MKLGHSCARGSWAFRLPLVKLLPVIEDTMPISLAQHGVAGALIVMETRAELAENVLGGIEDQCAYIRVRHDRSILR
jgi:hypothetical protein